jgi:phosphonate transport system substrate-binding protein
MKSLFRLLVISLIVLSSSLLIAQDATEEAVDRTGWPENFVVGIFGGDDVAETLNGAEPLRAYLEEQLGIRTIMYTGTSYTAVIEAMRAGRVDGFEVGPFSYILAVQEADAEALAVGIYESGFAPDAPAHYHSVIITKKGSGIQTLEDLEGRSFAFVDPASTSGHLAPKTLLMNRLGFTDQAEIDTYMTTTFAGSHPTAVLSVWNGTTDAGATFEGNLTALREEGQIDLCGYEEGYVMGTIMTQEEIDATYEACPEGSIVVLAQSDPIPSTPFAVRATLPQSFKDAVKATLLSIQEDPELAQSLERWYIDPSEELGLEDVDAYYDSIRTIAELLNLDLASR